MILFVPHTLLFKLNSIHYVLSTTQTTSTWLLLQLPNPMLFLTGILFNFSLPCDQLEPSLFSCYYFPSPFIFGKFLKCIFPIFCPHLLFFCTNSQGCLNHFYHNNQSYAARSVSLVSPLPGFRPHFQLLLVSHGYLTSSQIQ